MEQNNEVFEETSIGNLKISQDVIATVARLATLEIDGVDSVSTGNSGVKGLMTKTSYTKPIKIELTDELVKVEVSVVVRQGFRIPDLAVAIQQNVKNSVQSMTGLTVSRVDVVISGIVAATEPAEENK